MKRIKWLILLMTPILLTGCANNLKCEIDTTNYKAKIKIQFKNDKPTTYSQKEVMSFDNYLDANAEIYYHSQYDTYSYLITDGFAKIINQKSKVTTKINYDFTINSSQGENTLLISKNDNKETAKQKIESSSYKCK